VGGNVIVDDQTYRVAEDCWLNTKKNLYKLNPKDKNIKSEHSIKDSELSMYLAFNQKKLKVV
jgi:hypothetical protein